MASKLRKGILRFLSYFIWEPISRWLLKLWSKALRTECGGKITDRFMELLLKGMDLAFCLSRRYRKNIKGFKGRYVFRTADGRVATSAIFHDGDMVVSKEAVDDWDVRISFKNPQALWTFLLQNQDVLNSILADDVEIEGNLNYVYKFGFMSSDLMHRLGVA